MIKKFIGSLLITGTFISYALPAAESDVNMEEIIDDKDDKHEDVDTTASWRREDKKKKNEAICKIETQKPDNTFEVLLDSIKSNPEALRTIVHNAGFEAPQIALIAADFHGLHFAAGQGNNGPCIDMLLASGALIDEEDENSLMPLHHAARDGHFENIERLIAAHAAVNALTHEDKTPLHFVAMGHHTACVDILTKNGAKVNARDSNGATPLYYAALCGSVGTANKLMMAGADIQITTIDGHTPLHAAALAGHALCANYLLRQGALMSALTNEGLTPLHIAAQENRRNVVEVLLEHGADLLFPVPPQFNLCYKTAEQIARDNGHHLLADYLRELRRARRAPSALDNFSQRLRDSFSELPELPAPPASPTSSSSSNN